MPILLPSAPPSVQPYYDNSGVTAYKHNVASGSPFTWTQTATSGGYAIVALVGSQRVTMDPASTTAAVTFGGTSMSSLGYVYDFNVLANGWLWVFGLANVASGAPATVSVTLTSAGLLFDGFGASSTYLNVSSVGSLQTANGQGTNPSLSATSANGNLIWGAVNIENVGLTTGFTLAQRQGQLNNSTAASPPSWAMGDAPGQSSVPVGVTVTSNWSIVALNLI